MKFLNRVVLITGASSGIGAATAIKFSLHGAKVAISGRNEHKLKKVCEKCEANGTKPLLIKADVTVSDNVSKILDDTIRHFGKLDVLVNNVGVTGVGGILNCDAMKLFDKMISTNLRSAVYLTHLAAPHLVKTKGNIINISSIGATLPLIPNNFAYCVSKAGLDHFTRCVAFELASKGVRVNNVNPGSTNTDFMEHMGIKEEDKEGFLELMRKGSPLGKMNDADEIAEMILYLASDKAKSITGASFVVDNGISLKGGLV